MAINITAADVLQKCGISTAPVNLNTILNKYGITAFIKDCSTLSDNGEKVSGILNKQDDNYVIYIDPSDLFERQRFTVAHELCHALNHCNDEPFVEFHRSIKNKIEREADSFAAELLMPENLLRDEHKKMSFPLACELAEKYKVSIAAMKVRLNILGLNYYD